MLLNSNILDKFKIYRDDVSSGNRPVESAIVDIWCAKAKTWRQIAN